MKVQGHIYLADLLIEDLKKGSLTIPNAGTFKVPDTIKNAVLNNQKAFRAGTVGPDVHPDVYFGQSIIHTRKNFNSGLWLMIMFEELKTIKLTGLDKDAGVAAKSHPNAETLSYDGQAAYSYALGFMTHYATDMFTHTYVNRHAKGSFPDFTSMDLEDFLIIMRHTVLESYIDKKIPDRYKAGENIAIETPAKFLINCFGKYAEKHAAAVKSGFHWDTIDQYILPTDNEFDSYSPITWLLKLRNYLRKVVDELKPYDASGNIFSYIGNTNWAGYCDKWMQDVDKAAEEWIKLSDTIAKTLLNPKDDTMKSIQDAAKKWYENYFLSAMGIPDIVSKLMNAGSAVLDLLLAPIQPLIDEAKVRIRKFIFDIIKDFINSRLGIDVDQILKITKDPATYMNLAVNVKFNNANYNISLFDNGTNTSKIVDAELGNFGVNFETVKQTFKPFYDSLNLAKLCLIGTANINEKVFNRMTPEKQRKKRLKSIYATIVLEAENSKIVSTQDLKSIISKDKKALLKPVDSAKLKVSARDISIKSKETALIGNDNLIFGIALKDGREIFDVNISYKLNQNINGSEALSAKIILPDDVLASGIKQFVLKRGSQNAPRVLNAKIYGDGIPDLNYTIADNYTGNKLYFPANVLSFKDETESIKLAEYNKSFVPITASYASDKVYALIKTTDNVGAGTDDDVFFGVEIYDPTAYQNLRAYRVLCDKPGYNDFEKDDLDGYILELPRQVKVSEIRGFFLEKENAPGVGGDWDVTCVSVWLGHYSFGTFNIRIKDFKNTRHDIAQAMKPDIITNLSIDSKIVSYIKSLDKSYQWTGAQFLTHPNCQKIFDIGQIDETVQKDTSNNYSSEEYILRKSTRQTDPSSGMAGVFGTNDKNNFLIHLENCGCEEEGELIARLGKFESGTYAKDDALKRGFIDVGLCRMINGTRHGISACPTETLKEIFVKEWEDLINPVINSIKDYRILTARHIEEASIKVRELDTRMNAAIADFRKEAVNINAAASHVKKDIAATLDTKEININTAAAKKAVSAKNIKTTKK